jgi:hypothetical protein
MLLPASTGTGLAEFDTDKSAEFPTTTLADALLLPVFGSLVTLDATDAVCVMVEPEVVPTFTFTTKVKFALALATRVAIVQVRVPTLQVHPAGPVSDCAVVFAGVVSVRVIVLALAGPALATVWV